MIVGGKLYYQENAANFQKTLKEAIAAYGIPIVLPAIEDVGAAGIAGQKSYLHFLADELHGRRFRAWMSSTDCFRNTSAGTIPRSMAARA